VRITISDTWDESFWDGISNMSDEDVKSLVWEHIGDFLDNANWSIVRTASEMPTPGSDLALDQGCTCAVLDNAHGKGFQFGKDSGVCFHMSSDCPLHGTKLNGDLK